jgi:hypothetical protein
VIKILFASRLVHEKWVDTLIDCIESFAEDSELRDQIEWHICSDGDARDTIRELASKYQNITYYGRIGSREIQELYTQVDILFMPSRFLEMFWLTALEALNCGTPVCAPAKWGLRPFVTSELALDESRPRESFREILLRKLQWGIWKLPDISVFREEDWNKKLRELFSKSNNILIIYDYEEKIGWAEYYVELVRDSLQGIWKNVFFYGYRGQTTVWKRRIMFIFSIFAFWRGIELYRILKTRNIDTIWMHSVLRYIGPWWVLAVWIYCSKNGKYDLRDSKWEKIITYLSHHDLGLLAAFPQDITREEDIPMSWSLWDFIPQKETFKQFISIGKWCYVRVITTLLPHDITHIIFSPFLSENIRRQFKRDTQIEVFPHKAIFETSSSRGG